MKGNQIVALKRYIKAHVNNQVDLSWKGGSNPNDWDEIENNAEIAEKELLDYIESLRENKKPS